MQQTKLSKIIAASLLPFAATLPTSISAEEQAEERLVVTGSHIKRIDLEESYPITTIDQEMIKASGATSTFQILQMASVNGGGSFNEQFTTGFTPGAAAFDLRGFSPERTLVLLNGKRLPVYPFGSGGTNPFVDINGIPLSMVERVEILKDGSSAVYGSDAIAGVVNIITKSKIETLTVNAQLGQTADGGGDEAMLAINSGFDFDNSSIALFAEFQSRDEILASERKYSESLNGPFGDERLTYSYPGTIYTLNDNNEIVATPATSCNADDVRPASLVSLGNECSWDYADMAQISPEVDRFSAGFTYLLDLDGIGIDLDYFYTQVNSTSNGYFSTAVPSFDFFIAQDNPFNPINEPLLYGRALAELGAPTIETSAKTQNFHVNVSGEQDTYMWNASTSYVQTKVDNEYAKGWVLQSDFANFITSVENGNIDIFNTLSAEQIAALQTKAMQNGQSKVLSQSFNVDGPIMEFDIGELWMAMGLEARRESFHDRSDANILDGSIIGLGSSAAAGARKSWAAYAEFVTPLFTESLQLTVAGRYDDYDDFGSTANPKVSLRWLASDELLFRGSWGTGFRAPGLHQLHSENIVGSVGNIPVRTGGNRDLEAEDSESLTLGMVWEPSDALKIDFGFWKIEADNLISQLGVFTILTAQDAQGNFIYEDLVDANGTVNDAFINVAGMNGQGFDFGITWSQDFDDYGKIMWRTDISQISKMEREAYPGAGFEQLEGLLRTPKLRGNSLLTWSKGDWSQSLLINYIGDYKWSETADNRVSSWTTMDYSVAYGVNENLNVILGARNIMNKMPPKDSVNFWPNYDQGMYNPQGRMVYIAVEAGL